MFQKALDLIVLLIVAAGLGTALRFFEQGSIPAFMAFTILTVMAVSYGAIRVVNRRLQVETNRR